MHYVFIIAESLCVAEGSGCDYSLNDGCMIAMETSNVYNNTIKSECILSKHSNIHRSNSLNLLNKMKENLSFQNVTVMVKKVK